MTSLDRVCLRFGYHQGTYNLGLIRPRKQTDGNRKLTLQTGVWYLLHILLYKAPFATCHLTAEIPLHTLPSCRKGEQQGRDRHSTFRLSKNSLPQYRLLPALGRHRQPKQIGDGSNSTAETVFKMPMGKEGDNDVL